MTRYSDPVMGYDDTPKAPIVADALRAEGNAETSIREFEVELRARRAAEFFGAGGCARCEGHGTICVWGTLDSISGNYDQFGPCPDCDAKRDVWPDMNRGRNSGHPHVLNLPPLVQTREEQARLDALREDASLAREIRVRAERLYVLDRGCRVRVVKGRKVPKGSEGVVVWMGESAYGPRVGIVVDGTPPGPDGRAPAVFTAVDNIVVIAPSAAHRERVELRLPALAGSPKQIAWADKIRAEALKAKRVDVDDARDHYDARYWIDNRAKFAA